MARFECRICKCVVTVTSGSPGKCPRCGNEGEENWIQVSLPPLRLVAAGGRIIIFEEKKTLGRSDFRKFGKENYKYVDRQQLCVVQGDEAWEVEGISGVVNPTLLNGKELEAGHRVALNEGDTLQIGPLSLKVSF